MPQDGVEMRKTIPGNEKPQGATPWGLVTNATSEYV